MRHSTLSFNSSSHPETITQIGCQQSLIRLTAPKANQYSIDHFDHHIIGANEDIFLDTDGNANPQLSKKLFIKVQYVFTIKSLNKSTTTSFQQHSVTSKLMIHILTNLRNFH